MAAHRQAKLADINIGRDDRPVPAHIELILAGEDTLIEDVERRFQKRRTRPLQDHRSQGSGNQHIPSLAIPRRHIPTYVLAQTNRSLCYPRTYYDIEIHGARVTFSLGRKGERADRRFRAGPTMVAK